jgi:ABC-2 type transport system permease protein
MIGSITAELILLRKRASTWILLSIWAVLAAFFGYILPYVSYRNDDETSGFLPTSLTDLLPLNFAAGALGGFPFFGGVLILILGVITLGSEYGWNTLKTLFTQRPGRLHVFFAKLAALGIVEIAFVLAPLIVAAIASYIIARVEDAPVNWPDAWLIVRAAGAAWLILSVWAALGVLLAIISRGTALAIGIGILYGLVAEGLISALLDQVSVTQPVVEALLRANAYSLVEPLGVSAESARDNGPGGFSGPYVGGPQALLVLAIYLAVFVLIAATLLRWRDVD